MPRWTKQWQNLNVNLHPFNVSKMEKADRKINTRNARKYLPTRLKELDDEELASIIDILYLFAAAYCQPRKSC